MMLQQANNSTISNQIQNHQFFLHKNYSHPLLAESPMLGNPFNSKGDIFGLKDDEFSPYYDFFASNGDPESEIYYTSKPAQLEYNLNCDEQQFLAQKRQQEQAFQESEQDEINPMIVFQSYCIPQNFFEGQDRNKIPRKSEGNVNTNDMYRRTGKFQIKGGSSGRFIEQSQDYDKNICRYIARLIIRQFINSEYTDIILELTNCDQYTLEESREVFLKQIENISGHRAFRELLIFKPTDSQSLIEQKSIFKAFTQWFLKERAIRYIIKGDMKDKISYIRYKNDIMLYYIDCPEQWESNKCSRKRRLMRTK